MHRALLIGISFLALVPSARATEQEYPREVARWQVVSIPPKTDPGARVAKLHAASDSEHKWRVFADRSQICAQLTTAQPPEQRDQPTFTPKAGQFREASSFARVDDGWLVGFNQGEFGAALYWFSPGGQRDYKISNHQVVDFFSLPDGIHAIEGLAHLSMSTGSIIRITRPEPDARWQASTVTKLPCAPYAISVRRDGTMLVTLSYSLVSVGKDWKITTLLSEAAWEGLYPNSSVLSPDQQKLYIGMRQFVGEFDISKKKLRLLVPSPAFLNKLTKEDEQQIRKRYGR
jgi:hypothetical protein